MIFVLNLENFDKYNILVGNKENNLINYYNYFYKLNYLTCDYTLYGINIELELDGSKEFSFYNYIKIIFDVNKNSKIISILNDIECYILSKTEKSIKNTLYNDIKRGNIKVQKQENSKMEHLILRITGIWEDNTYCGISYKFIYV
jgi:hypothetical protein